MRIHDLQMAKLYFWAEAPLLLPHFTRCLIDSPCSSRQWSSAHHQLASDLQAIRSIRWLPRWITQDAMGGTGFWDVKKGWWPRFVDTDGLGGLVLVNLTRLKRHRDSQWSDSISNLCHLRAWYEWFVCVFVPSQKQPECYYFMVRSS